MQVLERPVEKPKWKVGTLTYTSGGLAILFFWLLFGDFAWSMRDRSVGPMAHWYLKHLGVSNLLFGFLVSAFPAMVGIVVGPVVSIMSDNHRGRWGRRIPFLMALTPLATFGMLGLAATPWLASQLHSLCQPESGSMVYRGLMATGAGGEWLVTRLQNELVVSILCFGVFWALFEIAVIAGLPVFNGLINDVVPKELIGRFYGLFRTVALLDGIIFNYWIIGHVPEHFSLILTSIGVFYGLAFTWVCFKVKEGNYPEPVRSATQLSPWRSFSASFRLYIRQCCSHRYYLSVFLMTTLGTITFLPVNAFAIPYARSVGMSMEFYGKCLALTFCISFCLSYLLGWLADLFHPIRVGVAALIFYLGVTAWGWLYASTAETFAIAFVGHALASGVYVTGISSLGQRLFPQGRFAQFTSAGGILMSFATIGMSPLIGYIIDVSGSIYRYTFMVGGILALGGIASAFYLYRQFLHYGGPANYVAPSVAE